MQLAQLHLRDELRRGLAHRASSAAGGGRALRIGLALRIKVIG